MRQLERRLLAGCGARPRIVVSLLIAVSVIGMVSTWPVLSQTNPDPPGDWVPPDLPAGVTLAEVVSQQKVRGHYIGNRCVRVEPLGEPYVPPIAAVMPVVAKVEPSTFSQTLMSVPQQDPVVADKIKAVRKVFESCRNKDDVVEVLLKANGKDRVYKPSEVIQAAEKHCSPERVGQWKIKYRDD